jgi:hypothetical protein
MPFQIRLTYSCPLVTGFVINCMPVASINEQTVTHSVDDEYLDDIFPTAAELK